MSRLRSPREVVSNNYDDNWKSYKFKYSAYYMNKNKSKECHRSWLYQSAWQTNVVQITGMSGEKEVDLLHELIAPI